MKSIFEITPLFFYRIKTIILLFIVFSCYNLFGQGYRFENTTSAYVPLSTGGISSLSGAQDLIYYDQDIGFAFNYGGVSKTKYSIHSGGFIVLEQYPSGSYSNIYGSVLKPDNGTSSYDFTNVISGATPLQVNYQDSYMTSSSSVKTVLQGSAPNRVRIIQYDHIDLTGIGIYVDFQIRLYETSNIIEIIYYNPSADQPWGVDLAIGIKIGDGGTLGSNTYALTGAGNWNELTKVDYSYVYAQDYVTFRNSNDISSGKTFRFTPVSCTFLPPSINSISYNGVNLSIPENLVGSSFQLYKYSANEWISTSSGDIFSTTSKTLSSLEASTKYKLHVDVPQLTGCSSPSTTPLYLEFTTKALPPVISYPNNIVGVLNSPITPLSLNNTGSVIPAPINNFGNVQTLALTGTTSIEPMGMVIVNGDKYVCDGYYNRILKINSSGVSSVFAGSASQGNTDGTGTAARFNFPSGISTDGSGNLYVADRGNNKIRKIVISTGVVTTIVGSTTNTSGSINGVGTVARFTRPTDVKFRNELGVGYLYVVDSGNNCIRKVKLSDNSVSTFAGVMSTTPSAVVNGALLTATFKYPTTLVFDDSDINNIGIIYVVDRGNTLIRKISFGQVSTFAGNSTNDTIDGNGTSASFADPYGIEVDGQGNLYVSQARSGGYPTDNPGFEGLQGFIITWWNGVDEYIRKITPDGNVSIFAGTGVANGAIANNQDRLLATFLRPSNLYFDSSSNMMYVSEVGSDDIRTIQMSGYEVSPSLPTGLSLNPQTGNITGTPTVATNSTFEVTGYNYYGSSKTNLTITTGNLPTFTTQQGVISFNSTTVLFSSTVSGTGGIPLLERGICWSTSPNPTINDNKVNETTLSGLFSSTVSGLQKNTTYYFKAYAKNAIGTSYTNTDLILKTFADKPTISYPSNTILSKNSTIQPVVPTITGGAVASETFSSNFASVTGQSLHLDGTLATCSFRGVNDLAKDSQGNIYTVSYHDHYIRKITPQGNVTVLAGTENTPGSTNGNISIATFNNPSGIVVDSNDNIFITDLNNNIIRKITPSGVVTTFATGFSGPYGIAIDVSNNLYVSEITANKIKKITPAGIVTVLAGSGTATFADGQGSLASFKDPRQLDVDVNGNIYVADSGNSRVRMITPSGMVSTIAGDGNTAVLNSVSTLALDNFGNIYVGDNSYKIKKITPSRAIVVIAGSGTYGSTNGIGSTSTFTNPACLYFDKDSNYIYIGFTSVPNSIRRLSLSGYDIKPSLPTGLVFNNSTGQITGTPSVNSLSTLYTVIAYNSGGSSTSTFNLSVVNSPLVTTTSMFVNSSTATLSSQITDDSGLAISAKGICWSVSNQNPTVSDNTLSGGTGLGSYSSFINSLSPSTTYYARAYVTNTNGTYYSSTISFTTLALAPSIIYDNVPELYVNASSVNISVSNTGGQVAANEQFISLGLNSLSTANTNAKAVVKNIATGDLFVLWGNEIKRVTPQGIITTYATDFNLPEGMSISSTGELYVANTGSNNIIKVVNGVKSVFAGSVSGLSGNILSTGQLARFNQPTAITIDSNNNLYIVDGGNSSIKKVSLSDQSVIQIINNTNFFYAKGITYGKIKRPNNYIGTDRVVNCLFISSSAYHKVLVFPLENNNNNDIYTIGNGSVSSIDGSQTSCSFSNPRGIVSTVCGIVYVTDFSTGKLRKIIFDDVNSAYVSTISTNSNLINPNGISCDSSALLIADSSLTTNNRISKVSLSQYSICPNLPAGLQFNQSSGLISGIPTQLTDPTTYTITGYNAGGISATNVNLSVIPVPTITADSIQYLCATAKVSDIVVNGAQLNGVLKYYTIPGFNSTPKQELVSSTQIVNGQHYFITQVVNNFESLPTEVQVQFSNIIDTNITSITEFNINSNQKRYSVNPISGTSYYKWSLPSGFVVTSESQSGNQITVTIPSDFVSSDGVITVQAFGPCNGSAIISRTLTSVTPIVTQTGDIGCSGTATVSYSVDPVANSLYSWTLPTGMSIISNNNNQIQVNVASGFTSGNVQVGISNSNSTVTSRLAVARANSPVVINGSRNICSLSSTTYSVAPVAGATSYVWSVPTGMTITGGSNTETISVSINESLFTSGNISVFAVTNCGNSASRTLSVSKAVEPSAISGPKDICSNKTKVYSIDSSGNITSTTEEDYVIYATGRIIGANNVQWSVPTGSTLVSGQGTYIAAINFDANTYTGGAISFTNLSNCIGTSPVKTLAVTKGNPVITGPTNLCGLSIAVYSIPNSGTNFNWIVPSWMTITNGQGTNEITVSFTKLCTTDSVSVSFTSVCGSSSTPTTITKTGIGCSNYSSLATTSCGITLSTFDQTLTSVPVANATSYRFNVDDGISIRQYTSTTKTFKLTNLTGVLLQNTQYSVSVDVLVSGTWYEGGCYCFVTTPTLPTTSIQSSQCGVTLSSYVTPISADAVTIATKYKFRVVEGTNQDVTYESTSRQILLTDVVGLTLSNNTTYQISVAVLIDGRWSSFGSTCSITMPDALTTSLIPSMCNGSLVSLASFITANNITGATSYKFKVVGGTINATYINTTRQFKLTDLPNQVVDLGTTYEVSVSVGQNGQYHSYGPACTVSTPALSKVIVSQCGSTLPALNTSITADLISGATQYKFKVYGGLIDTEYISPNSTRVFKLTDIPNVTLQFGTTYQVSVSVRINNKWSAYGLICNINTPVSLYTTLISAHCNSTLTLLDSYITANNVAGATSYRFKVIGGSINTEYVSSTRQFKLTDIPNQVVDFGTTYQVSVAVGQDGYYHNYGHICSVTTPSLPQIITPQCGTTLSTFGDNITANLISAATKYKFKVVVPGADPFYYESNIRVLKLSDLPSAFVNTYYDYGSSTFQTKAFRYNTPFEVSVSVFVNGSWSNYGNVCQLTSPSKVNIPIQSSYCGQTINSPCDKIYANISNLPAIESFRFVLGNGSSNQWGGVYDTTNNWCSFNDFTSFQNNNNYSLYVEEVKINGIWYDADISSSCSITSPVAVTTSIVQCGTSLTSFDSLIEAVSLPNATQYKFKVINPYNYMYYEHVSSLNSFKLTDISGSNFDYNTPYLISVAVKISDCWQRFSQVCQISTPQEPVSQLVSSYCDSVLNSLDQTIYANPVYGALNYRFELLDHDGYPYSYTTSNPYFKLTDFNGLAYPYNVSKIFNAKYNTSYTIHVSVNGGVFSNDCIIYTPKVKVKNSLCGVTLSSYYDNIQTNSASFIGITKYKFEITYSDPILGINYDQVLTYETTNRYFKLQNVPGLLIRDGVDYQVRVAVQTYNNNAWSPFGDVCTVSTPFISSTTSVVQGQCGSVLANIDDVINLVQVTNATKYRVYIYSDLYTSGDINTATFEILTPSFKLSDIDLLSIYANKTYSIMVAALINNRWMNYGNVCTITTPQTMPTISILPIHCNQQFNDLNEKIYCENIGISNLYRFNFIYGSQPQYYSIDTTNNWITLADIFSITTGGGYNYNESVTINVQYKYRNADNSESAWSDIGSECVVLSPHAPHTNLLSNYCNNSYIYSDFQNNSVTVAPISGALAYSFKVTKPNGEVFVNTLFTWYRTVPNEFNLGEIFDGQNNVGLYLIQVAPVTESNYSNYPAFNANDYGDTCLLTLYDPYAKSTNDVITKDEIKDVDSDQFGYKASAYPNPFSENYSLIITSESISKITLKVYDISGRLIESREVSMSDLASFKFGESYTSGVYTLVVQQDSNVCTLKMIKK